MPVRIVLVLLASAALGVNDTASAAVGPLCVKAVPGLDLSRLGDNVEVFMALVVPDAGPTTSEARARASLLRGQVRNSLHSDVPEGPRLLRPCNAVRPTLVGIPRGGKQSNDRRYAIALAPDGRSGVLVSSSTRIPGLISIADVAHPERLTIRPQDAPVAYLRDLDARIRDNGRARLPAAIVVAVIGVALAFVRPRAAVLAFATAAAANLVLGVAGVSEPWLVVGVIALGALAAVPAAAELRSPLALGLALLAIVAAYLVAMAADATWVALSPLGPSQNGRFYGVSNLLETLLLVPALAAAALLFRRFGWAGLAVAGGLAIVTVAGSRFGADGGGAIVLAAGYAALGVAYARNAGRGLIVAAAAAAAVVAVVALDALLGPATHVGEAVRGGPGEVASDIGDRLVVSWRRATENAVVALVVAASIAALAFIVARGPRRALPLAFAVAIAVSLLVNDSPREVSLGGLAGYLVLARFARADPGTPDYT